MNTTSDAAEQIVRMSLQGVEVAAKISGVGAKNVAAILVAIAKDQKKLKGKTTLTNLIKSGRPLKVFSLKSEDLKKFVQEAKKYGVLYSVIIDKSDKGKMIDIMVREEDASKINRIVDKFKLSTVDIASVQSDVKEIQTDFKEKELNAKVDNLVDELLYGSGDFQNEFLNPDLAKAEKSPLSEPILKNKKLLEEGSKSVREEIKKIKEEKENKSDLEKENTTNKKQKNKKSKNHVTTKKKKIKKVKEKS